MSSNFNGIFIRLSDAVEKFIETNSRSFNVDQIVYLLNRLPTFHAEDLQSEICDNYCKWPGLYGTEKVQEVICPSCPLRVLDGEGKDR